jgi:Sec7-like guanine-nucleotide exchange factor
MAGIDSQVVNRIIENFGLKFAEHDKTNMFKTSEEAYEFAYLLIVLHTV